MGLQAYLILAAAVFCIGLFGVITRRNTIGILLGIELMLNAVNINLVAFSRFSGNDGRHGLHGLRHLHHRGGSRARPRARHPALPHPPHGDGGSPRSAEGMMQRSRHARPRLAAAPGGRFLILALVAPLRRLGRPAALPVDRCARRRARRRRPGLARRQSGRRTDPLDACLGLAALATASRSRRSACSPTRESTLMLLLVTLVALPRAGLLARLSARRAAAGARPLLRVPVAVRVLDDGPGARAEPPAALHLLGAGRPLLVPADRLLVSEARGGARGGQGVLDDEGRRRRPAHRHRAAVAADGHVRSRRAARRWSTSGARAGRRALASSRSASTSARPASRRSSRCTSGCPTRWKARRRSPR